MKNLKQKIIRKIKKLYGEYYLLPQAINFFDQDWEVLIILDGCRYDTFQKINTLEGNLTKKISRGTCTPDWAQSNFSPNMPNINYVSGNPFVSEYFLQKWFKKIPFHQLFELWDKKWDSKLKTVTATTIISQGLKTLKKDPRRKLVLHFMQPHHPFIGKHRIKGSGFAIARDNILKKNIDLKKSEQLNVYQQLEQGLISRKEVLRAYESNLEYVLHQIESKLLPQLAHKKIVITADHGNCFGEDGILAHPSTVYVPNLLTVPWLEIDSKTK